jgi:hypothetical protein
LSNAKLKKLLQNVKSSLNGFDKLFKGGPQMDVTPFTVKDLEDEDPFGCSRYVRMNKEAFEIDLGFIKDDRVTYLRIRLLTTDNVAMNDTHI